MSSESMLRGRVLRGSDAAGIHGAALDTDLSVRRIAASVPGELQAAPELTATVEQARDEAARVGYEDGYQAGLRAGEDELRRHIEPARERVNAALRALESAALQLGSRQEALVADVERHVASLAISIAEAVLGRELAAPGSGAQDAITRALQLAPSGADVVVRLHPDDAAALGDVTRSGGQTVTVVADPAVEPGGCIADAGPCRIDAQIGPALDRVREVLAG